jgi:hypothetical protein
MFVMIQAMASSSLIAEIPDRYLDAISKAETNSSPGAIGDHGNAVSEFQIWASAWSDANAFRIEQGQEPIPRKFWIDRQMSREIARSYLEMIESRMIKDRISPTPAKLYLAYTMGYSGAKKIGFNFALAPLVKRKGLARFLTALSK